MQKHRAHSTYQKNGRRGGYRFFKSGTIKNNSEKRAILDQRKNNTPNVKRRANEVSDKNNINTSNNTGNRVRFLGLLGRGNHFNTNVELIK